MELIAASPKDTAVGVKKEDWGIGRCYLIKGMNSQLGDK